MEFTEERFSCENCPCLNNDYEKGESCNLGFDCDSRWNEKKQMMYTSNNCGLKIIKYNKGIFRRSKKYKWTNIHPSKWIN